MFSMCIFYTTYSLPQSCGIARHCSPFLIYFSKTMEATPSLTLPAQVWHGFESSQSHIYSYPFFPCQTLLPEKAPSPVGVHIQALHGLPEWGNHFSLCCSKISSLRLWCHFAWDLKNPSLYFIEIYINTVPRRCALLSDQFFNLVHGNII